MKGSHMIPPNTISKHFRACFSRICKKEVEKSDSWQDSQSTQHFQHSRPYVLCCIDQAQACAYTSNQKQGYPFL